MEPKGAEVFLCTGEEIRSAIRRLIEESTDGAPIRIAVAFWGTGAEDFIPSGKRYNLACNLSVGATNPAVIRTLAAKHQVRHLFDLHAKVAIGQTFAVVGSANFSAAGLGLASASATQWREAAVVVPKADPAFQRMREWFMGMWAEAHPVDEVALGAAERAWNARILGQFATDASPPTELSAPLLTETLMFGRGSISSDNRIRMAAGWIEEIYSEAIEPVNKSNVRVPAFAANILWTLSGLSIETRIEDVPRFYIPEQVIYRASDRGQPRDNLAKLSRLMRALLEDPRTPEAVKFWVARWLARSASVSDLAS